MVNLLLLDEILYANLRDNIIVIIIDFQLKANSEIEIDSDFVNYCCGVTKDPNENDYLLVFDYAKNGDLHNHLLKNFKEITWQDKIKSLLWTSWG